MNKVPATTRENIRACAGKEPYREYMTWYLSGDVYLCDDSGESCVAYAVTIREFNAALIEYGFEPIGYGRTGKRDK